MLNPIPIQFLAPLAYFILRFGIGTILLHIAFRVWSERAQIVVRAFDIPPHYIILPLVTGKVVIAIMLLLGWYTQYAAIALMLMCIDLMMTRRWLMLAALPPRAFYALLFFAAASLCITGAGAFAVDLPI